MFIVRFIRLDGLPDEEYYYHHYADALDHFNAFLDDDCGLYMAISLSEYHSEQPIALNILPGLSQKQKDLLTKYIQDEQFETCLFITHMAAISSPETRDALISLRLSLASISPNVFKRLSHILQNLAKPS